MEANVRSFPSVSNAFPALLLLPALSLSACGDRKEDSAAEGSIPDPTGQTCSDDAQCGDGTICEAGACEPGDRSDSPEEAIPVFYEEDNAGIINPVGDEDWFSFSGNAGSFVRISTAHEESALDTVVSLYDAQGSRLAWEDGYAGGTVSGYDSLVHAFLPVTGTYYVKVEDMGSFYDGEVPYGSDSAAYDLRISSQGDGGDEADSLQSAGQSHEISGANIFYPIAFSFPEDGDSDYCSLILPYTDAPIYLFTMQNDDGSGATPLLRLYDSAGVLVFDGEDPARADGLQLLANQDDRYVLEISDASGGSGADHWGWAFVIIGEPGDGNPREEEPNDEIANADSLSFEDQEPDSGVYLSGYGQGFLSASDDVDTWAVPLAEELYISIALGAQDYGGLLQARIEVLDAAGVAVATVDSPAGADEGALNLGPFPAGDYFVRFSGVPDSGMTGGEGFFYRFGLHQSSFEFSN